MQIIIDDWWEMVVVGIIILSSLFVILLIIKQFFNHGGTVKTKNLKIGESKQDINCSHYIEHTKIFEELKNTLIEMEKQRKIAREENSETNKTIQIMFRTLATSMDGLIEAFQKNNIGNGNLEKARKNLSKLYGIQDDYLINNL